MLLAEIQAEMRRAIVAGDESGVPALLAGGRDARKRLAIHQRHYAASLTAAILGKFPATVWLTGSEFVAAAASRYVVEHPPQAPCIAEYGDTFPAYLAECPGADRAPYLRDFAELEWCIGQVSIAVDESPIALQRLSEFPPETLSEKTIRLQPGLRYQQASWPVDELLKLYLTDNAPPRLAFDPADTWIEIRGARGEFHIERLDAATFTFRNLLVLGRPLGDAAESALERDEGFDAGRAMLDLLIGGWVIQLGDSLDGDIR